MSCQCPETFVVPTIISKILARRPPKIILHQWCSKNFQTFQKVHGYISMHTTNQPSIQGNTGTNIIDNKVTTKTIGSTDLKRYKQFAENNLMLSQLFLGIYSTKYAWVREVQMLSLHGQLTSSNELQHKVENGSNSHSANDFTTLTANDTVPYIWICES